MSFGDILNRSGFFRRLLYYPLVAGFLFASSCNKDNSENVIPTNPGGGNGGYVEDRGTTNGNGELNLEVEGQKFDIKVTSEDGNSLENITIKGTNFDESIYGFLFEDFNGIYFSDVLYVNVNGLSSVDNNDGERIRFNNTLSRFFRTGDYKKEVHKEPYPYNLSQNENLSLRGTIPIDELYNYYVENDAIFKNMSVLEFVVDLPGTPDWLSVALEAAKFRQTFIENLNNYNDVVNSVANFFGGSFEKEAYYIDVYENKFGVLTHQTSTRKNYITLKGKVYDNNTLSRIGGAFINITRGPILKSVYSDDDGTYFIKFLTEGIYDFTGSHSGFDDDNTGKRLSFFGYVQPKCESLDFYLTREHQNNSDTLILQPGPEGKDASVHSVNLNTNYDNEDKLYLSYDPWERGDGVWRSYLFLDISYIPLNSNIRSARLQMRGASGEDGNELDDSYVAVKKVLDNWNENQIKWSNQPRFGSYTYAVSLFSHWPSYEWKTFDLTRLVQEWVNENSNKGIALVLDQESGRRVSHIYSSDHPNPDFRYKFEVVYEF